MILISYSSVACLRSGYQHPCGVGEGPLSVSLMAIFSLCPNMGGEEGERNEKREGRGIERV
jgi:hypothetical protein